MATIPSADRLMFDRPVTYQIQVLGQVNEFWLDRLEGMSIKKSIPGQSLEVCALEGELLDQAALLGVLIWLYELHLPLLSVKCLSYPLVSDMDA